MEIAEFFDYVKRFNEEKGETPESAFQKLLELSKELCGKLNEKFPRGREGEVFNLPFENLMWAISLISSAWLGWVIKSKSIWHYDKRWPEEDKLLSASIVPSVIEAFGQGIVKAIDDKIAEGKYPT